MVFGLALVSLELLLFCVIGILMYLLYTLPPLSLLLRNYYRSFFHPLFLLVHALISVGIFVGVEWVFVTFHHRSFFELPLIEQVLFVGLVNSMFFLIVRAATPLFPVKTLGIHEVAVDTVTGSYQPLFKKAVAVLEQVEAHVLLELPEKRLIIAQTPEVVAPGTDQVRTYIIELTFSEKSILWGKMHIHTLCYPAHRRVFVEKKDMQGVVREISSRLQI